MTERKIMSFLYPFFLAPPKPFIHLTPNKKNDNSNGGRNKADKKAYTDLSDNSSHILSSYLHLLSIRQLFIFVKKKQVN